MNRDYDQVVKALNADLPSSEIAYREAGNGKQLAYIEGWVAIDLMNEIIGIGNWAYQTLSMKPVYEGTNAKGQFITSYIANVQLTAKIGNNTVTFNDYGYGDGSDKTNPGKAHELAVKEAVTDGIKRCVKSLGRRVGLALYDKTQQFVTDGESDAPKAKAEIAAAKTNGAGQQTANTNPVTIGIRPEKVSNVTNGNASTDKYKNATKEEIDGLITATSRVVIKKGKATKDALVSTLKKEFNTDSKDHLNIDQARKFLLTLESMASA